VDLTKVLAQLRMELQNLDTAIASLEKLAAQKRGDLGAPVEKKRRGRPPKHQSGVAEGVAVEKRAGSK